MWLVCLGIFSVALTSYSGCAAIDAASTSVLDAGGSAGAAASTESCPLPKPERNGISEQLSSKGYAWLRNVQEISPNTVRPSKYHAGRCAVSDRFKFVFHHVLKSGGSSMIARLKLAIGGAIPGHQPGNAFPVKAGRLPYYLAPRNSTWLRFSTCDTVISLGDYVHFSFVRDPYLRLRSIQAFAHHHRSPGTTYRHPIPSLETLATSSNPPLEFRGSTKMGLLHAAPQYTMLLGADGWGVDFIGELGRMNNHMREYVIPVIKARIAHTGIDTQPLDQLAAYFNNSQRANVMKKNAMAMGEERHIHCLLYKSPAYGRDYELFYAVQERQRRQADVDVASVMLHMAH